MRPNISPPQVDGSGKGGGCGGKGRVHRAEVVVPYN